MNTTVRDFSLRSCPATARRPTAARRRLSVIETIALWSHRVRTRRELARLDDRMLRDIGIDPYEAEREAAKPFWQP